jgi:hypothetical protein
MSDLDRETQTLFRSAQRVAQKKARTLLREMQVAVREKAKARRISRQRLIALGSAVVAAGCGEWDDREIREALAEALDRIGESPVARAGLREMGENRTHLGQQALGPVEPVDEGARSPRAWEVWPREDSS